MNEDELTNHLLEKYNYEVEDEYGRRVSRATPEVHYNHYGTRGVADLFVRFFEGKEVKSNFKDRVIEIKANPTSANETIRQFKKMVKFFYKGSDYQKGYNHQFRLMFIPSADTYEHVRSNIEMYKSVNRQPNCLVLFSHPNPDCKPIPAAREDCNPAREDFAKTASVNNMKSHFGEVLQ